MRVSAMLLLDRRIRPPVVKRPPRTGATAA